MGGDTFRSGLVIQDLLESGIRLFYFYADEEVTLDGAVDKFMIAVRSFAAELETKARRGLVAGGIVYGYHNVASPDGAGKIRAIDKTQADIVREVFERYAKGEGLRTICKSLSERCISSPRAGKRGIGAWVPSAVHAMLRRPLYIGRMEWGHVHKTYRHSLEDKRSSTRHRRRRATPAHRLG